ncbi:hypothetical protein ARMSODRAFT_1028517 [Armillaria solidipes]|uniref:F-box domain-containing protein n=1 Tax=Armillaria solidipes TaxID=1076256 RepID=A0A2H3AK24_9AGAR|nr:hypothetical protein ARMSODRAFT_1028517 [Armillaria solidipes]
MNDIADFDVGSCAEDEEIINSNPPGFRVLTLESYWDSDVTDLINVFTTIPWYRTVETLTIRCRAQGLDRFFASLPNMKLSLKTLHCKTRTRLTPVTRFQHIESLSSLEVFGINIRDADAAHVLPKLCQIASPHFHSLTICYAVTGVGNSPFEVPDAWMAFRESIKDHSRFPALSSVEINIYDDANCGYMFMRIMRNNLKYLFSYMGTSRIDVDILICSI